MSTPVKLATSLLINRKCLSPRSPTLLSPLENTCILSPARIKLKPLNFPKVVQKDNKIKNSAIQINITHDFPTEDSLIIDSPHKKDLLNYGLDKHDLLYLLGKGSFGTVIKGNYKGNLIAVKLVKLDKSSQINESNAFGLVHENIIKILDIITSEKYALITMEYYQNSKNLQCVLDDANFVLNEESVVGFSRDVTKGLKYCHEHDILHLDIKPKNILLCNNITCKICDFGNSVKESNSQMFKHQGTVAYTAPEILRGRNPSAKSDIYSLGMLIWQLMSRKSPYEFLDSEVVIYKVVKFNLRPPVDFSSKEMSKLCSICWDENPSFRPDAAQVCGILDNILSALEDP